MFHSNIKLYSGVCVVELLFEYMFCYMSFPRGTEM